MSDNDLTPAERAEIERVHGVLADPAIVGPRHRVHALVGARPSTFPSLTITKEVADGNQASSGHVVLTSQANESRGSLSRAGLITRTRAPRWVALRAGSSPARTRRHT